MVFPLYDGGGSLIAIEAPSGLKDTEGVPFTTCIGVPPEVLLHQVNVRGSDPSATQENSANSPGTVTISSSGCIVISGGTAYNVQWIVYIQVGTRMGGGGGVVVSIKTFPKWCMCMYLCTPGLHITDNRSGLNHKEFVN